jgi:hypothetical protein
MAAWLRLSLLVERMLHAGAQDADPQECPRHALQIRQGDFVLHRVWILLEQLVICLNLLVFRLLLFVARVLPRAVDIDSMRWKGEGRSFEERTNFAATGVKAENKIRSMLWLDV